MADFNEVARPYEMPRGKGTVASGWQGRSAV